MTIKELNIRIKKLNLKLENMLIELGLHNELKMINNLTSEQRRQLTEEKIKQIEKYYREKIRRGEI